MKTSDILIGSGVVLLAIYLVRKSMDKKVTVEDIKSPVKKTKLSVIENIPIAVPKKKLVLVDDIKAEVKTPIVMNPTNLIPSVYDRGIGEEVNFTGFYQNMGGKATENIQNACKCADKDKPDYKLEIPQII